MAEVRTRRSWLIAAALGLLAAACSPPPPSTLTVVNSNPYAVTVSGPGLADASIGACGTARFTWGPGWRPVSGTESPHPSSVAVTVYAAGGSELPFNFLVVVAGDAYTDYSGMPSPSIPACVPASPAPS